VSEKGITMKVRTAILCAAGLLIASIAPLTYGKGIRVDAPPTLGTCTAVSPIDAFAANLNPNVGISITSECNSTSGVDQALGNPFESGDNAYDNANLYDWDSSGSIVAQVADYTLSGGDESANSVSLSGLTEIEFNYSDCTSVGPAELTMGGVHYTASCNATNETTLLFNSTALVGWLNNSNDVHACAAGAENCLSGSGWSTASSVPEPGSLALFGLAMLPLFLALRRRMKATRLDHPGSLPERS
jgi:PEP-CTERM motif